MRGPHNILRLIRTGATFERTGAMRQALDAFDAPKPLRIAARVLGWPFAWLGHKGDPSLPPVPRAITALGPAYIKFGQILSTRPDVVGPDIASQLRMLQDRLPPFPQKEARRIIEKELGAPVEALFDDFEEPIAAASIAQVHRARVRRDGRLVAVKIVRPGIARAFSRDIDAFYLAANLIEMLSPGSRRLKPTAVVDHFNGVVQGEQDLRNEAAAASEFQDKTKGDAKFRVPDVVWPDSSRSILTTGWMEGIPMGEVQQLRDAGHDLPDISQRLLQLFLTHALRDGFFHADLHQGNIKIAPDGTILTFDFGIMGRIDRYTRRVYAEILYGFLKRDYRRVAEVHFEAGYVPQDKDVDAFAQALRSVGEPIFGQDAAHISMARLLAHLFEVTERFGMATRTELILLQRTMVVVEGVGRSLDPNLNLWEAARPVVEDYIRRNLGPQAIVKDLTATAQTLSRFGPLLEEKTREWLIAAQAEEPKPKRDRRWLWWSLGGLGWGIALTSIAVAL
ncbi:2-polyprenylphenol 6-hydroxylase [Paracoccaceae bacterium GXU_MW_L88]